MRVVNWTLPTQSGEEAEMRAGSILKLTATLLSIVVLLGAYALGNVHKAEDFDRLFLLRRTEYCRPPTL